MELARKRERQLAQLERARERYRKRAEVRTSNDRLLEENGAGGADPPERQMQLAQRDALRSELRILHMRGQIPAALERIHGPTFDILDFAPSEAARAAGKPVARLCYQPSPQVEPEAIATGFLVSPRLLLTNQHVFGMAADCVDVIAQFQFERSELGINRGMFFKLAPQEFFVADEDLDFALVAVEAVNDGRQPLSQFGFVRMIEATPKAAIGDPAHIIQHPGGRSKGYAVSENRLMDILDTGFLHYETDTESGSSGSPVYSKYWELIALHHSAVPDFSDGEYRKPDGSPWDRENDDLDDLKWIANEGARCSTVVAAIRAQGPKSGAPAQLLREFLDGTADPIDMVPALIASHPESRPVSQPTEAAAMSQVVINVQGSSVFNFQLGATPAATPVAAPAVAPAATPALPASVEEAQNFDPKYDQRPGYDPDFLGMEIPLPEVTTAVRKTLLKDDGGQPWVIPYHHFSLTIHGDRRSCVWTALNADYAEDMRDERNREAFGGESWRLDPRLKETLGDTFQISDGQFYKPAKYVDRGHIVRREDNCWGRTRREREYANADTYHYTNCTPQHEAFNQETPKQFDDIKGKWGWFERELAQEIQALPRPQAVIMAGPVLKKNDPIETIKDVDQQYPLKFWKVVAYRTDDGGAAKLHAMGFIFDQSDVVGDFGLGVEEIDRKLLRYQVSIDKITKATGVLFPQVLLNADAMAAANGDESIRIRSMRDLKR